MSTAHIIVGILLFALATVILYIWGLRKSMSQDADLRRILTGKCANHIVKYLKKYDTITDKEIIQEISGIRAGQFWSKKKVIVQEPKKFAKQLTAFMVSQQLIESAGKGCYRLKK